MEINEAFAAQACAVKGDRLGHQQINVSGAALGIDDASGCRALVTLYEMRGVTRKRSSPRCASAAAWASPASNVSRTTHATRGTENRARKKRNRVSQGG
jgi:acetyl-CoA acetyltransferase